MTYREAPATSRAAQVAQIHLNGINESRRRCGLDPLDVATLEHEFADVNQSPPARTKLTRRDAGNLAAPSSAQEITSMWDGIVEKLNASLPASRGPDDGRRVAPRFESR
jgi:hypothetical protein